tara:strand:- start:4039 stop:5049 length:1011 start_codon:yes stop_codon:yes gene_type:complete
MSEQEKSGEGLIEQAEETVAQEVETKEEASPEEEIPSFDPKAFSENEETEGDDLINEAESKVEEQVNDDFDWGSVEVDYEKEEEPQQEEEDDWDSVPESATETSSEDAPFDWSTLANELDLNAKDEESFKNAVRSALSKPAPVNDTIDTLQSFLKQSDANLVASDLKASGLTKEEVTDTVERLQDSGLLKREAIMIRKNLQNYIASERTKVKNQKAQEVKQREEQNLSSRKSLQKYIKSKEDFFGGKIGNKERKELYNYVTSGGFAEEVYSDIANVADAAFLWKYKDKIFKMLRGQGMEKGKASVINKITNTNLGRRSRQASFKPKSGFDPVEFMK